MAFHKGVLLVLSALLLPSLGMDFTLSTSHEDDMKSTSIDDPKSSIHEASPNKRRQYGQTQRSDQQIQRLMHQYSNIVKKYGPDNRGAQHGPVNPQSFQTQGNNTNRLYVGQKGPLRHNPRWRNYFSPKPSGRQDADGHTPQTNDISHPNDANNFDYDEIKKQYPDFTTPQGTTPPPVTGTTNEAQGAAVRFTTRKTTTRRRQRTTPYRETFKEQCDFIAYYCMKAYERKINCLGASNEVIRKYLISTGKICARTMYMIHMTFENYCMVDYVNCMERYDVWQIAHMGECFKVHVLTEFVHYPYLDDYFLDNYYIVEDM